MVNRTKDEIQVFEVIIMNNYKVKFKISDEWYEGILVGFLKNNGIIKYERSLIDIPLSDIEFIERIKDEEI